MQGSHDATRAGLDALDHQANFLYRILGTLGKVAYFVGHNRKTSAAFAGPRGLDRGDSGAVNSSMAVCAPSSDAPGYKDTIVLPAPGQKEAQVEW